MADGLWAMRLCGPSTAAPIAYLGDTIDLDTAGCDGVDFSLVC
jgi:hypothetical protein